MQVHIPDDTSYLLYVDNGDDTITITLNMEGDEMVLLSPMSMDTMFKMIIENQDVIGETFGDEPGVRDSVIIPSEAPEL